MEHVYLQGSEAVQNAGREISSAAETIRTAVGHFDYNISHLTPLLNDLVWELSKLVEILKERK